MKYEIRVVFKSNSWCDVEGIEDAVTATEFN
jgi:hypothetical protein